MKIRKLSEPTRIGALTVKNRFVMPAMLVRDAVNGGYVSDVTKFYFEQRARGGAGLIIVGACAVDYREGRLMDDQLSIDDDRFIPGLSEVAKIIKSYGARAGVQLQHGGNVVRWSVTHLQPVAPSPVARPGYEVPRELSPAEIGESVSKFARSAGRAVEAGFDAVEISACHRYLVQNFLSSAWNKRNDEYGGGLRNRAKFLVEIVKAIKERVGHGYPLLVRLNGMEYGVRGGTTLDEAKAVAVMLQEAGVHALHVSAFPANYPYPLADVPPDLPIFRPGCYVHLAEGIKKVAHVPVVAVGRISPELGETLLRRGKADLIAFGRGLIVDPELPNKAMSGRLEDIRRCLGCQECYDSSDFARRCTVNAAAFGKEREYVISPAKKPKRVLVVGGGPAGMETARVAAVRGHEVTLWEKGRRLGGQLILAGLLRDEYDALNRYLATQLKKLGVRIQLRREVTPATIRGFGPDTVVIATGPGFQTPSIPGFNGRNVISPASITRRGTLWGLGSTLMASGLGRWAIKRLLGVGAVFRRTVVIMGGGLAGMEIADFLMENGRMVTIVTEENDIATGIGTMPVLRQYFLEKLSAKGVPIFTGVKYEKITERSLVVTTAHGEARVIEADTVVYTSGVKPSTELYESIQGAVPEVYIAGDSANPRGILEAIRDGFRISHGL